MGVDLPCSTPNRQPPFPGDRPARTLRQAGGPTISYTVMVGIETG